METVKEIEKLLDIDLSHLVNNLSTTENLETINRNSEKMNNVFGTLVNSDNNNDNFLNPLESLNFRSNDNITTNNKNPIILREYSLKSVVPKEKRTFLKKGDGLKRFKLNKKDITTQSVGDKINENPKSKNLNKLKSRKIVSLSKHDEDLELTNKEFMNRVNLLEEEYTEKQCETIPKTLNFQLTKEKKNDDSFEIDDTFIMETKNEIQNLEQRIKNLKVLKNSINELAETEKLKNDDDKLHDKLIEVQKNLHDIKTKLEALPNNQTTEALNFQNQNHIRKEINPVGYSEIKTDTYVRRIYTDKTVQTIYLNGIEEWLYPGSRLRYKNSHGDIIFDQIL